MSRLSPEAEQLVRAGRSVLRPNVADRERVFQGLLPRVGGGPGTEEGMAQLARAPSPKATLVKVSSVLVGLGIAGGALFLSLRPQPSVSTTAVSAPVVAPPASPAVSAPVGVEPVAPADVASVPEEAEPSPPSRRGEARQSPAAAPRARAMKRAPTPPGSEESLAREVALLSRAGVELHAARPAAALEVLDEHAHRFPNGVLAQERAAARARALCALGRMAEARAELARLTRAAPGSPHVARATQACASAPERK